MPNQMDRRDYDVSASQSAQDNFNTVAQRLEALIDQRQNDVNNAMRDYEAEGVSTEYHGKELRWHNAAAEVKAIIRTLRTSLVDTDDTAALTLNRAKAAVDGIG